ncbi:MAG: diacylglycerol kinase family lipid kinase [Dehalococcoidales bacterium]|nr:diacylglycerol kinase family lipid kinase [Dehalococcoidales bacterium]
MSSTYAKVIVNPAAGAGKTARLWPQIMDLFKGQGLRFEHDITEAPGHAIELAREAACNGYNMVVSVGGDGTINEIVNGIYASGNIKEALLGIVSTGTGSDYIRTIGIPKHFNDACRCFVEPRHLTVDLGMVEYENDGQKVERLFVNFAGMGFDAEIVRRTTQQYKAMGGLLSYLVSTIATILTYRNKDITLIVDGGVVDKKVCTVVMNNGRYGGGGMFTAPHATIDDGYFDVMIIGDISKPDLLWSLPRVYRGTHLTHPRVTMRKAKEIEIRSAQPMHIQADGELLGQVPARFRILPSVLKIVG